MNIHIDWRHDAQEVIYPICLKGVALRQHCMLHHVISKFHTNLLKLIVSILSFVTQLISYH